MVRSPLFPADIVSVRYPPLLHATCAPTTAPSCPSGAPAPPHWPSRPASAAAAPRPIRPPKICGGGKRETEAVSCDKAGLHEHHGSDEEGDRRRAAGEFDWWRAGTMPTASCGVAAEPDLASLALSPTRRSSRERGPACAPVRRGSRARRCSRPAAVRSRGGRRVGEGGRQRGSSAACRGDGKDQGRRRAWVGDGREREERGRKIE